MKRIIGINRRFSWLVTIMLLPGLPVMAQQVASTQPATAPPDQRSPLIVHVGEQNLQKLIDEVPAHSVIICNRNQRLTLSTPIVINRPLTLRGLNAQLPPGLGRTPLVVIQAPQVCFTDFELHGNGDSVDQKDRCALMCIHASEFAVERGSFSNSSKDGVMIESKGVGEEIVGGVVRDVVGTRVIRDVVSLSGGTRGGKVRNVLVENLRSYQSAARGAIESSDGTEYITIRKVYAEDCVYAVDVSDHSRPGQDNRNLLLEDITAVNCRHVVLVRITSEKVNQNTDLTIRNVTAKRCVFPVRVRNSQRVLLDNVRIIDHGPEDDPVVIDNCDGVTIRDLTVTNAANTGPVVQIIDCNRVMVDGLVLHGETSALTHAIEFLITAGKPLQGLSIRNVSAPSIPKAGILLSTKDKGGSLKDFIIAGNLAHVVNEIPNTHGLIRDNLGGEK